MKRFAVFVPRLQDGERDGAAEVVLLADGETQVVGDGQLTGTEEPAETEKTDGGKIACMSEEAMHRNLQKQHTNWKYHVMD